jgi:hypothetical protein
MGKIEKDSIICTPLIEIVFRSADCKQEFMQEIDAYIERWPIGSTFGYNSLSEMYARFARYSPALIEKYTFL